MPWACGMNDDPITLAPAGLALAILLKEQQRNGHAAARQLAIDLIACFAEMLVREIGADEVRALLDETARNLPSAH
jgi:hypothetical protein